MRPAEISGMKKSQQQISLSGYNAGEAPLIALIMSGCQAFLWVDLLFD
jgi:hypothetical protein